MQVLTSRSEELLFNADVLSLEEELGISEGLQDFQKPVLGMGTFYARIQQHCL